MKDPFEAASERAAESPPESPIQPDDEGLIDDGEEEETAAARPKPASYLAVPAPVTVGGGDKEKGKEEDDDDDDENMEVELGKLSGGGDPHKLANMQAILSQFSGEQMSRYESFRRSGFQRSTMKRLLASLTGTQKISVPMTIVVSGIGKLFVGDLIETGRIVMAEREESGPIRPCHIREAYRRLKLEGKIPKRSVPRLFH